jgi:hypothetical protein
VLDRLQQSVIDIPKGAVEVELDEGVLHPDHPDATTTEEVIAGDVVSLLLWIIVDAAIHLDGNPPVGVEEVEDVLAHDHLRHKAARPEGIEELNLGIRWMLSHVMRAGVAPTEPAHELDSQRRRHLRGKPRRGAHSHSRPTRTRTGTSSSHAPA